MAIYRVHKIKNFTSISNYLIKDENLSLKDKGMMVVLLSLPETWEYSVLGLENICKESKNTINDILNNLEKNNYLERKRIYENGRIKDWRYDIYEIPKNLYIQENELYPKKQDIEKQDIEILDLENSPQLNTNKLNTKKLIKEIYGTYKRIKLTKEEYEKLVKEFGKEFIDKQIELLDEYVESNNNKNKYTNFNLVLRKSIRENWFKNKETEDELPYWLRKDFKFEEERDEGYEDFLKAIHGDSK